MNESGKSRKSKPKLSGKILRLLIESGNIVLENRRICKMGERFYIELPKDYKKLWMYLWKKKTKITMYLEWKQDNE